MEEWDDEDDDAIVFSEWEEKASLSPLSAGALEATSMRSMTAVTTTITYEYDPLYRLTAADYDDGSYFHYTYDQVGNRLVQATDMLTSTYSYR